MKKLLHSIPLIIQQKRVWLSALLVLVLLAGIGLFTLPDTTVLLKVDSNEVAYTSPIELNPALQQSDITNLQLKPATKEIRKTTTVEVPATGTKFVGQKATGEIIISHKYRLTETFIPKGTVFAGHSTGLKFVSTADVTVPKVTNFTVILAYSATVPVQAMAIGEEYNINNEFFTIEGIDQTQLSVHGEQMNGGSKQAVTVVSQADFDAAKAQVRTQEDATQAKEDLRAMFGTDFIPIDESFLEKGTYSASPSVGEQATKTKVTLENTYSLQAISRGDAKALAVQLSQNSQTTLGQELLTSGDADLKFANFEYREEGVSRTVLTGTASYGAIVDTNELPKKITGKKQNTIISIAKENPAVQDVSVSSSPSWIPWPTLRSSNVHVKVEPFSTQQ